jgi:tRNA-specific 2-thiouridylase
VSQGYDPEAQYTNIIELADVQTMNPVIKFVEGQNVRYKIRHQPEFRTGTLSITEKGLKINSDVMISGVASGQFGTIYHETEPVVLGSGVIE